MCRGLSKMRLVCTARNRVEISTKKPWLRERRMFWVRTWRASALQHTWESRNYTWWDGYCCTGITVQAGQAGQHHEQDLYASTCASTYCALPLPASEIRPGGLSHGDHDWYNTTQRQVADSETLTGERNTLVLIRTASYESKRDLDSNLLKLSL